MKIILTKNIVPCLTCKDFFDIIMSSKTCEAVQLNMNLLRQHIENSLHDSNNEFEIIKEQKGEIAN